MKKRFTIIITVILFLAGLSLLLYPFVANQWNTYRQTRLITDYEAAVAGKESQGKVDYEAEWDKAVSYNEALVPYILPDSFAEAEQETDIEEDRKYMSCLNLTGNGIMGYVQVPKINIRIPIFHTVNDDVLQIGAGHLEGSSLPVGGENNHAVISAHRGLPSAALFTDLDKMEEGDHFLLYILDDILCYEVDQITVVEPEDTRGLMVQQGKDLVTLLTCTPYGVNSHRLLVRGHRVPYEPENLADEKLPLGNMSFHTSYLLWVVVGLLVTGGFILLLYLRERKRKQSAEGKPDMAEQPEMPGGQDTAEAPEELGTADAVGTAVNPENTDDSGRAEMPETTDHPEMAEHQGITDSPEITVYTKASEEVQTIEDIDSGQEKP